MEAMDRIKKGKVAIMRHPKFSAFSGVLAYGQHTIDDRVPTACTNGKDVKYNAGFVGEQDDPQLRFLMLHEGVHVGYRHLTVWRELWKEDRRLANIAADHFVNLALVDTDDGEGFIRMPDVGIQPDPKYRGWSVKQIFEDLKANPPPNDPRGKGQGGGGGDNPDDPDEGGGFDEHDWEASEQQTEAEAQAQAREIDQALRQGEMIARKMGKGKGASSMLIEDLLKPRVDWRELLREFIQQTCQGRDESTWAKPNRRYVGEGVYMPSMQSTQMGELVVVLDTSGSCFEGSVIKRFVSELATIVEQVKPSKVHVLYVDWEVRGAQAFEDGLFAVGNMQIRGGGGTDMTKAFGWVKENRVTPEAMCVFTDGFTPFGQPPGYPVLWAITEKSIRAPWGTTVHVEV
jgi:predicted metal-dependent peptidase